jgi:hypothetical protein
MSTPYYNPEQRGPDAAGGARRGEFQTLSSKMFDTYLTDIEQLLHHQIWSAALTDALALPHIAVALGDTRRRSSAARYKAWCANWIRPDAAAGGDAAADGARFFGMWCERAGGAEADGALVVPVRALRQLRLRRLARPMSPGCHPSQPKTCDADAAQAVEVCTELADAANRWYTRSAARDDIVQANLARLAVMR